MTEITIDIPDIDPDSLEYIRDEMREKYDKIPCDYCGEKLGNYTVELRTGQVCHKRCEQALLEELGQ